MYQFIATYYFISIYNSPQQNDYIALQEMFKIHNDDINKRWQKVNSKSAAVNEAYAKKDSVTIEKLGKESSAGMNEIEKERELFQDKFMDWQLRHVTY